MRRTSGDSEMTLVFPIRFTKYLIPETCSMTRDTPLVPYRRHGGGFSTADDCPQATDPYTLNYGLFELPNHVFIA